MKPILTPDQEQDLRDFFQALLSAAGGLRSWLGPMVDQKAEYGTILRGLARDDCPSEHAAFALKRHMYVLRILAALDRDHVKVLKAHYGATPVEAVRGFAYDFPDGLAPIALVLAPAGKRCESPGSQLREWADKAHAKNGCAGKPKNTHARDKLTELKIRCRLALRAAQGAYWAETRRLRRQQRERRVAEAAEGEGTWCT